MSKRTKCKMDLIIKVPHEIKNEFLSLLDIAQSQFTEDEVAHFTMEEKKLLAWVRNVLLDGEASSRFATNTEREKAGRDLARIFSGSVW